MLDINYLHECFEADFEAGTLRWKVGKHAGKVAGCVDSARGYIKVRLPKPSGKLLLAHRVLFAMRANRWPYKIDHIDGNPANNSAANLREVGTSDNAKNTKVRADNSSGVMGVRKRNGKWYTYITSNGQRKYLGTFSDFDHAVEVRKKAEAKLGFHENHGRTV